MSAHHIIVLDVVGLSFEHLQNKTLLPHISALLDQGSLHRLQPVFPALTMPVQASMTTGSFPETHGVVANGFYFPELYQVNFWEQASSLVQGERIWDQVRKDNRSAKTAALFFQNTLYADCDVIITPRPMHTDDGLVQWCYSKPLNFYEELTEKIGEFNLMHYWGPMASIGSSRWIAGAVLETLERQRPELMFVYLPHLDYCTQVYGPGSVKVLEEVREVDKEVGRIVQGVDALKLRGNTTFLVLAEYAFQAVQGDIPLNKFLRERGLLRVRTIAGREYLDLELSSAFAMVDHQIAHVYIKPGYERETRAVLEQVDGIDFLLDGVGKKAQRIGHARSGDIVAVSARNRWFSYYWWTDPAREPDFASHVDIHRKPGYDPLELCLEPGTRKISQDTSRIKGSHGCIPSSPEDEVPLIISGQKPLGQKVPDAVHMTEIAPLVRKMMAEP